MEKHLGHVLVVDDFQPNRDLLKRRLTQEGYQVSEACDGEEAIELLNHHPYDIVLLDILMPRLNGFQVLEYIKQRKELASIPVIVISAMDQIDGVIKAIELGAEDYLTKPFNPVLLKARIKSSLEKKRIHDLEIHYLKEVENERKKVDKLLRIILPDKIVDELKTTGKVTPRLYENVAILFCDIVDFSLFCNNHTPDEVVNSLEEIVENFEILATKHQIQKMKTIGDAFMCSCGLMEKAENPVQSSVDCGLEMAKVAPTLKGGWEVRVGVHVGPVIAGVVGKQHYLFDVWGETVNIAARLCAQGSVGSVMVSKEAWDQIAHLYEGTALGKFPVKGIGYAELYRVERKK
jgi:adenylate cyclase